MFNLSELIHFQKTVKDWVCRAFGQESFTDKVERDFRFFEEVVEGLQARGNLNTEDMQRVINSVMAKPPGEFKQEVGGIMTTFAAMCESEVDANGHPVDMFQCGLVELQRIRMPENMAKIRQKQLTKVRK